MKKILIIDDDEQVLLMLKAMLEREEFDVTTALDGKEGIRLFKQNPADLVITDIIMPEKEGLEIIIELKINQPDLPVIAISGGGWDSPNIYLDPAKAMGINAILEKPIELSAFVNAVKKALER